MLYRTDRDRRRFLALLGAIEEDFDVAVLAYVLMGNHYHLVLRSNTGRLAQAMQYLDGGYAKAFNAVHDRHGALFQGRYDARPLDDQYALTCAGLYVHLNPHRAGLVPDPADYRWSSLGAYLRGRSALPWLHLDLLDGRSEHTYAETVASASGDPHALQLLDELDQSFTDSPDDDALEAAFAASDRAVAAAFGVSIDELYIVVRGRSNTPRMVAMAASLRTTGVSAARVAERYGAHSASTVHTAVQRLRRKNDMEPDVASRVRGLGLNLSSQRSHQEVG